MGPRDTSPDDRARSSLARRNKALLVHEEPEAVRYYSHILEGWGYQVRSCHSYQDGARYLESEFFDFVMVSQGSQSFEGRLVVECAREFNQPSPVLVVARCPDISCYLEAMRLGAVDYLAEPVSASEMGRVLGTGQRA